MPFPVQCRDHCATGARVEHLILTDQSVPGRFAVFSGAFWQGTDAALAGRNCADMPSHVSMEMMTTSQIVAPLNGGFRRRIIGSNHEAQTRGSS